MTILDPKLSVTITTVEELIRTKKIYVNLDAGEWGIRKHWQEAFLFGSKDVIALTGLPLNFLTLRIENEVHKGFWIGLAKINPELLLSSAEFPEDIPKDAAKLNELRHRGHYTEVLKAFSAKVKTPYVRYMVHTDANRLNAKLYPSLSPILPDAQTKAFVDYCRSWQSGKDRIKPPANPDDVRRMHMNYVMSTHIESSLHIPGLLGQRIPLYMSIDIAR